MHCFLTPEAAHRILVTNGRDYGRCNMVFDRIRPLTGNTGLVQLQGQEWKDARSQFQKLFSDRAIASYGETIEAAALRSLDSIDRDAKNGEPVELTSWVTTYVLSNALRLFGGKGEVDMNQLAEDFLALNLICGRRMLSPVTLPSLKMMRLRRRLVRHVQPLIDGSILALANNHHHFTSDQIRTFLFAGHETTTSSIVSSLHLLARHPEVQTTYRQLSDDMRSDYLENIYHEALRLYPPAWILARTATSDDESLGVKRGDHVIIAVREIQRDARYWDDPESFRPERNASRSVHPGQFIPFGAGPKICIGKRLAVVEATTLLRTVLDRFHVTTDTELQMDAHITLFPRGDVSVHLHPLNNLLKQSS